MNEREIVHENTRLDVKPYGSHASADALNKAASIQAAASKGKVDAMGNEIGLGQFGYRMNYVVTPSPAPGRFLDTALFQSGHSFCLISTWINF